MARTTQVIVSAFLLLVVTFVAWSGAISSSSSTLRGADGKPRQLQHMENPPSFLQERPSLQLAFENPNSLSPELFNNMVWTFGNSDEERTYKQEHFYRMVRYHARMRPCLHKSFWAGVQFLNPGVYNDFGLTAQEKDDMGVRSWLENEPDEDLKPIEVPAVVPEAEIPADIGDEGSIRK